MSSIVKLHQPVKRLIKILQIWGMKVTHLIFLLAFGHLFSKIGGLCKVFLLIYF